jgi:hypothetical protein
MVINMDEAKLRSIAQLQAFLNRDFPIELNFYWKPLENHHDFIEV